MKSTGSESTRESAGRGRDDWSHESLPAPSLVDPLVEDMIARWRSGERPVTEDYLARFPELREQPEAAVELLYEELCLRRDAGLEVSWEDLAHRFPEWREHLLVLFACHQFLETSPAAPLFPELGEMLGDYRLLTELGHGARGRVFLATQPALADRPIVLKLVPRQGREHLSLARLQHTHIVPLYAVHDFPARLLRALCMPYFGSATLAELLARLNNRPPAQCSGRDILEALESIQAESPVFLRVEGPACQFLAQATHIQAICWIGACLADALENAHQRGLVHFDIKPSNVLLGADGEPMLLDFHLARGPVDAGGAPHGYLGGTPSYMAPEQQSAVAAAADGRCVPGVDHRADIYSLGLVLYEALGGLPPTPEGGVLVPVKRCNPRVSTGLSDLIHRCLAADPCARYPDAASLAADLRRHVFDLPLRGVTNRNLLERWSKWRKRRPRAVTATILVLVMLVATALTLRRVNHGVRQATEALVQARTLRASARLPEAAAVLDRGRSFLDGLPWARSLTYALNHESRLVQQEQLAAELHALVERIRFAAVVDALSESDIRILEANCRDLWRHRDEISRRLDAEPTASRGRQVRSDLLELAVQWVDLLVRSRHGTDVDARRRDALRILREAEESFGASPVLARERQSLSESLGLAQRPELPSQEIEPHSAWELFALGRSHYRLGNRVTALGLFDRVLDLEPQDFWSNFYKGKCAYDLGRHDDAVIAFSACVALAPNRSWCFVNRALGYVALGRADRAMLDYDHALRLDPTSESATRSRGMLHYQQREYTTALVDLRRALELGAAPATYCDIARVQLAQGDRVGARDSLKRLLSCDSMNGEARALLERLPFEHETKAASSR
jgi:eukaryotic-like serine/threonine-protein kinase